MGSSRAPFFGGRDMKTNRTIEGQAAYFWILGNFANKLPYELTQEETSLALGVAYDLGCLEAFRRWIIQFTLLDLQREYIEQWEPRSVHAQRRRAQEVR